MLVIDEVNPLDVDFTDPTFTDVFEHMKDGTGARYVITTTATLDVT
jgi:hypothetical protein